MTASRSGCLALDMADPLAVLRDAFVLPEGVIYLDGNSLGAMPKATAARIQQVVQAEWGTGLIRSWNDAGWIDLAERVGERIGRLIGASAGEVVVADSTSVNLFKVLSVAAALVKGDAPERRVILSERGNFPTDLYLAESVAASHGLTIELTDADALPGRLDANVAVLMLTHVDYRSGRMHDLAEVTRAAHAAGAQVVWDLAHSAGAVPVDLTAADADFAVGCGYKYLNGGPGAPAFVWVHPRHLARLDEADIRQPLTGWLGHAAPFEFQTGYRPASGIRRFVCGTPPVLSLAALEVGLAVFDGLDGHGGMAAVREKSIALTTLFIDLLESGCTAHGLVVQTPRDPHRRGSQVSATLPEAGHAVMQALIARGVIGDFRAPDVLRFGFAPLYTRYVDVWDAAEALQQVLVSGEWRQPQFQSRATVT